MPFIGRLGDTDNSIDDGTIENKELKFDFIDLGGVKISLGQTISQPAFDLSNATGVGSTGIADNSVTNAKLQDNSVTTEKIVDGAVTNIKLANDSVNYGGVELSLGQSDLTPSFDLTNAFSYGGLISGASDYDSLLRSDVDDTTQGNLTIGTGVTLYTDGRGIFGSLIGIGTDNPTNALHIQTGTSDNVTTFKVKTAGEIELSRNHARKPRLDTSMPSGRPTLTLSNAEDFGTVTEKVKLNTAGDSFFNGGNVGIGSTIPAAKLDVVGSASFAGGKVVCGTSVPLTLTNGSVETVQFRNDGSLKIGGTVGPTSGNAQINSDGTATFAGNLDVGSGNDSVRLRQNIGSVIVSNSNVSSNVWSGQLNTNTTSTISASGSASFDGDVSVGVGLTLSAPSGVGTAFIYGPDTIIIDPSPIGDPDGVVRIRGDLFVEGTETVINSDTLNISDFIIGIASTATTNVLADGCGLTFGPTSNSFLFEDSTTSLKSSIHLNLASGSTYKIDGINRLSASSLNLGTGTIIQSPASNELTFETNSNERLRIASDGNIYTKDSDQQLRFYRSDGARFGGIRYTGTNFRVTLPTSDQLVIEDASANELLRVDPNTQRIGIGTNSPVSELDVDGTITGSVLVSDVATGTAPLTVSSSTLVTNLNADLLDGQQSTFFLNTSTTFGGDVSGTYNNIAVTNDSHTHQFNNLTNKTSGTGDYTTTGNFTASRLISTIATGTAPISVASSTLVSNLNADLLDSQEGSYYLDYNNFINTPQDTFTEVADDTTPQLGGTLDTNGNLIQFGDSTTATDDRLQFGAAQDLQMYHDGSDSWVEESGPGNLYLNSNGTSVNLRVSSTDRLTVNATGVSINGTLSINSSTLVDNLNADLLDGQEGSYYLNTSTTFGGDVSGTYNNIAIANDSHTHAFNNLTSKTSGTGNYTTTGTFTGNTLASTVATGTAPLTVTSTTLVSNLNADLLDGQNGSHYLNYNNLTNKPTTIANATNITVTATSTSSNYKVTFANVTDGTAGNYGTLMDTGASFTYNPSSNRLTAGEINLNNAAEDKILLNGSTSNWIQYGTAGVAAPAFTTRSAGTKLVLYPSLSGTQVDYGLGIESSTLWYSVPTTANQHKWYGGTTEMMSLTNSNLDVVGSGSFGDTVTATKSTGGRITLSNSSSTSSDEDVLGYIDFGRQTDNSAWIAAFNDGFDGTKAIQIYMTDSEGVPLTASNLPESGMQPFAQMTITPSRVGIGLSNPSTTLDVSGSGNFSGSITGSVLISDVAGGTAPLTVTSTTLVSNLNADLLDGQQGSHYLNYNNLTNKPTTITNATNATNTTNINISATTSTDTTTYPTLVANSSTGNQAPFIDTGLSYNANTNTLTATTFNGALSGNATTATQVSNTLTRGTYLTGNNYNGSAATTWAVDATSANTASKVVARDASGNFSAGTITATTFSGSLSGNATSATNANNVNCSTTTDITTFPVLVGSSTAGNQAPLIDAGISYNANSNSLTLAGDVIATNFNSTSDIRLKENIEVITDSTSILKEVKGVKFDWKETKTSSIGVIAQDVEKVLPQLILERDDETKTVNYNGLVGVLIEAVKELTARVEELEGK